MSQRSGIYTASVVPSIVYFWCGAVQCYAGVLTQIHRYLAYDLVMDPYMISLDLGLLEIFSSPIFFLSLSPLIDTIPPLSSPPPRFFYTFSSLVVEEGS
ncbi:hypothetical protein BDR22DRAFT_138673 [Usnea florida]